MTQRVSNEMLKCCVASDERGMFATDLLSLRAAVLRVLDAEDAWAASVTRGDDSIYITGKTWREARRSLRAEMAGIDGGKEQKP